MTEAEFLDRWNSVEASYVAWGKYVTEQLQTEIPNHLEYNSVELFIRIPIHPRLKTVGSMLEKAFYRGKTYPDPFEGITDKIGLRVVVLLASDINRVEKAVSAINKWIFSRDKDFDDEMQRDPTRFDYAAVHYVVRNKGDFEYEGVKIPVGMPCEIQVKTLLQHAYAELTHDSIYKTVVDATNSAKRSAAKSAALLEATNDYFQKVIDDVNEQLGPLREASNQLSKSYEKILGSKPQDTKTAGLILHAYSSELNAENFDSLDQFFQKNSGLQELIKEKASSTLLFRQSPILLVYYLAFTKQNETATKWPLLRRELKPVYTDLGLALDLEA
jgi:putative GTP pyrophosphokinase